MKLNHPIFDSTEEVEDFVHRRIDEQIENRITCDCCNHTKDKENIKCFDSLYYVCEDCWHDNKNRAILDIQAIYRDENDIVPYNKINDFFKGYWDNK